MDTLKLEPRVYQHASSSSDIDDSYLLSVERSPRVEGTFRKLPTDFEGPVPPLCTGKKKVQERIPFRVFGFTYTLDDLVDYALRNCPGDHDTNPESTRRHPSIVRGYRQQDARRHLKKVLGNPEHCLVRTSDGLVLTCIAIGKAVRLGGSQATMVQTRQRLSKS
ncbi:hypothetical protein BDN71DRAFT_1452398 [Pleurotus eryngii]|uniref:Uncharacterized protein n=1 Tax=Pleurotus eryngii TaxID=5323 RepID=A0A9P6D3Z1_PLEER|nr:hypothetical protein BDN71DRAFT_1452398 [Pleurotus eryngii]